MDAIVQNDPPTLSVNDIQIVIAVNKKDVWFCRICVASIRHFYPETAIFLLKDDHNGSFSTKDIEEKWNVSLIDLGIKNFGWSAAKIFLYTDQRFNGKHLFVIDSDIVFVGKILDAFLPFVSSSDVIVSGEPLDNPYADWVKNVYFDVKDVENHNPSYTYPGYFFNAGQLLIKVGFLKRKDLSNYFDFSQFPYWKKAEMLPLVDQSLFNYLFPIYENDKKIQVKSDFRYMLWSREEKCSSITIESIEDKKDFPYLIHWAGDVRTAYLNKMMNSKILNYFERKFYDKIPMGTWLRYQRRILPIINYYEQKLRQKIRSMVKS